MSSQKGHRASVATTAATAVTAALMAFSVVGCGGHTASDVANSPNTGQVRQQLNTCISRVGATNLLSSTGRSRFTSCMETLVPGAKRQQFRNCIASAVEKDELWTTAGRTKFRDQSLPSCLNAATA